MSRRRVRRAFPLLSRRTLLKAAGVSLLGGALGCAERHYEGVPNIPGSRLYPATPSLLPGETLKLQVSSPAPQFRVDLYRQGARSDLVYQSEWRAGSERTLGRPDRDFDFPTQEFSLPAEVTPGIYIAKVVEGENDAPRSVQSPAVVAGIAEALFVVRTPAEQAGSILYKLPLATYHAYNFTGGGSLYHVARHHSGRPVFDLKQEPDPHGSHPGGVKVTFQRPGGGAGANTWHEEQDHYDPTSPRNTFAHWDKPFVSWLEKNGYAVDYCVDLDVHQDPSLLRPYSLLISAGHDEYWSEEQRAHTEHFLAQGGNLAFFTGNTCWWRVHYVDGDSAMICDKHGRHPHDQWYRVRPEDSLTGVSYRHAGSWWRGARTPVGYTVQHADHWCFAKTGLRNGDVLGRYTDQPLVGYECDGAPFVRNAAGWAVASVDPSVGTPSNFLILGVAELGPEWPTKLGQGATMGTFSVRGGGTVFNAATTDWAKLLERDPALAQITRNVLDHLSGD